MEQLTSINDRIRSQLKKDSNKTQAGLAKACGISTSAVAQWITKNNGINYKHIPKIANYLGVSERWLVDGDGSPTDFSPRLKPVGSYHEEDPIPSGYIAIPEYRICFGAGSRAEPTYEEVHESKKALYRQDFFDSLHIDPKHCKRFKVNGDSMEPTLNDGDTVLIVESQDRIIDGGIYVFFSSGRDDD